MLLIDTNILLDAANRNSEFHQPCLGILARCREKASPWFLTWPICYEFLRVVTHPAVLPKAWGFTAALQFVQTLLHSPSAGILLPTARHSEILAEVAGELPHLRGNILHDVHTAVLMREHGICEIYTRDTDFSRFPFLRVLDPLA